MLLANYKFYYPLRILSYRMKWKLPQIPKQVVHKICAIYPKELYPEDRCIICYFTMDLAVLSKCL